MQASPPRTASRLVHRARAHRQRSQLSGLIVAESLGGARSLFERLLVAGRQGPGAGPDEAAGPTTPWSRRRRCSRGAASSASASGSARWSHPRRSCCRRPSSSRPAAAARSLAAAAYRYWRRRSGSGWWPSSLRPCLPLEGSRGAVVPLRALPLEWRGAGASGARSGICSDSQQCWKEQDPPPGRFRFARARTGVRGVPRTSGLPLAQQADATSCDMALLGCRLLGRTRLVHGDRGSVVRPVLGSGGATSVLAGYHPSDGVSPAHRWLWKRRMRRRRASDLRSLLFRGHGTVVDEADEFGEVDEECARANAGSGSHNLDAPYLARQRCRGKLSSTNTYGAGAPFRFGGGRRLHEE